MEIKFVENQKLKSIGFGGIKIISYKIQKF